MRYKKRIILMLAIIIFFCPTTVWAWGQLGHRIIGEMASEMLSKKATKRINNVLCGASVAMVANWADFIRPDTNYSQYVDWHFTNLPQGLTRRQCDSAALSTADGQCVYRIITLTENLRQNPQDAEKLKILIHLVGDMFQPLHLGRKEDVGGNNITIKWFSQKTNLHTLWDRKLIDGNQLSYTEYAAYLKGTHRPKRQKYSQELVLQAVWNTYSVAHDIYESVSETAHGYKYIYTYEKIWEKQLVDAAVLLASILEYIY